MATATTTTARKPTTPDTRTLTAPTKLTLRETMARLESMGTAQNRKIYARHGAPKTMFGVSFANLNALRKLIKRDHDLALKLWDTGNMDAQTLATMIVDPAEVTPELADAWLEGVSYSMLVDLFATSVVALTPFALEKMNEWIESDDESVARAGWALAGALIEHPAAMPDPRCDQLIARIERDIHAAPNRAREMMNRTLIALGTRSPRHRRLAQAAALRIGKVEIDHGDTECKTPDAAAYIDKVWQHRESRSPKPAKPAPKPKPASATNGRGSRNGSASGKSKAADKAAPKAKAASKAGATSTAKPKPKPKAKSKTSTSAAKPKRQPAAKAKAAKRAKPAAKPKASSSKSAKSPSSKGKR